MKKKTVSLLLVLAMTLSLMVPALAAGPTFSDVPEKHWAYKDVEAAAEAGVMKGTGGNQFSPDVKVSVAQFLTLIGRVVFPETKVTQADTWYGPYVTACQSAGLLTGTQVDVANVEAEISRYDMAVILRAAAKKLGMAEKAAQQGEVADFGMIPNMYTDAVLAVYGMGLIRGDGNGNFNGANTMTRAEVATVIMRLKKATPGGEGIITEPEGPVDATYKLEVQTNNEIGNVLVLGERAYLSCRAIPYEAAPDGYSDDRNGFVCTSSDPSVVEVTGPKEKHWFITAKSVGSATITVTDPYGVSGSKEINVVTAREGMETKTYTLIIDTARQAHHSLRGAAYTEHTLLYGVPYKVYYTRDGGKTSQLVYEGISPKKGEPFSDRVQIELPEDAEYSTDAGFYVSAETTLDGQRLVTSDLRTDGRAYVSPVWMSSLENVYGLKIDLTPPTGEKAEFTIKGYVGYGRGIATNVGEGFTVQLHLKDGRVVAETSTDASGHFTLNCEVDAIDNGFNTGIEQYYITASGVQDGVGMADDGTNSSGELVLRSSEFMGGNPYSRTYRNVMWGVEVYPVD